MLCCTSGKIKRVVADDDAEPTKDCFYIRAAMQRSSVRALPNGVKNKNINRTIQITDISDYYWITTQKYTRLSINPLAGCEKYLNEQI